MEVEDRLNIYLFSACVGASITLGIFRCAGVIDVSWWIILAPLWGYPLFCLLAMLLCVFFLWVMR